MAVYKPTNISKKSLIALLYSDIDQKNVRVRSTGEIISNPKVQKDLLNGIKYGTYEYIELMFPKSALERTDNWEIDGIDLDQKTALVTISTPSTKIYISCELNFVDKKE